MIVHSVCGFILEHEFLNELVSKKFENRICDDLYGFGLVYLPVLCALLQCALKYLSFGFNFQFHLLSVE